MRRAYSTMHYYTAHQKRAYASRLGALQRACAQVARFKKKKKKKTHTQQRKTVNIGAAAAVAGYVQQCINGRCTRLSSGKTVFSNGTIKTGRTGRIQIIFNDETVFTMGPNTEIVLDTYVYDPYTKTGEIDARINRGAFRLCRARSNGSAPGASVSAVTGTNARRRGRRI